MEERTDVGTNDGAPLVDVLVGLLEGHLEVLHQEGDDNGRRARDAHIAMDETGRA